MTRPRSPRLLAKIFKFGFLVALATLSSCSAPQKGTLRIGTNLAPGYEFFYLARERGWLDPRQVHLVEYSTATEVLRAFRNRIIDAAAITMDEAILLAETGEDVRIVLVTAISSGSDAVLASLEIQSMADLRGRRVAVENTAFGAYLLQRALDHAGLTRDDLEVVPLPVDQHERAFRFGRVDALVTFDPMRSRLVQAGAHELFSSRELPGEVVGVLAIRSDSLERLEPAVTAAITNWFRAVDDYAKNSPEALLVMAKRHQMSDDAFRQTLTGLRIGDAETNKELMLGDEPRLVQNLALVSDIMIRGNLLASPIDTAGIVDSNPLQVALNREK